MGTTDSKYKKRQLKKAARLTKKAEKQEKKAAETRKNEDGLLYVLQPSGKRARKRANRAANKAKAGSRKAYKKGKKEGIYKTGGFLEAPIESID